MSTEDIIRRMKAFGINGVRAESVHLFIKSDLLAEFVQSEILAAKEECAQLCDLWNATPGKRLAEEIRKRSNV